MVNQESDTLSAIKQKLDQLKAEFIDGLPSRYQEIQLAYKRCTKTETDTQPEDMQTLTRLVHSLSGSAAMYSLDEVSHSARSVEEFLATLKLEKSASMDSESLKMAGKMIETLGGGIRQADSSNMELIHSLMESEESLSSNRLNENSDKKILIIEDSPEQLQAMTNILSHFGFTVKGLTGIEDFKSELSFEPDLILMDIVLQDDALGGTALIQKARDEGLIQCSVLFISVRNDFHARLASVRAGADGYMSKPFSIYELVDTIEGLTSRLSENSLKVMIIDDDVSVTRFYKTLLENAGMKVLTLNHADKVMEYAHSFLPDLIVVDMYMPDCNGIELAKLIKQVKEFIYIPIIFLTNSNSEEVRFSSIEAGAEDFLNKGISPDQVVSMFRYRAQRGREMANMLFHFKLNEQRFKSVSQSILDAIITVNNRGVILFTNPAAERLFASSEAEILGGSLFEFMAEDARKKLESCLELDIGAEGEDIRSLFEIELLPHQGEKLDAEITVTSWQQQNKIFYTLVLRDISKRKETEALLVKAKEHAEEASRVKGAFLSSMSHELKTPLNAIIGYAEILRHQQEFPQEFKGGIDEIYNAGEDLLALINGVLDLGGVERGGILLNSAPYLISDLHLNDMALLQSAADKRNVKVSFDFQNCSQETIDVDKQRFKQVVFNLISNGIKYNSEGGFLKIDCQRSGETIRISFTDQGVGLAQKEMASLFLKFNRLGKENSNVQGVGIGLVLSKKLVEMMSGNIGVESTLGQGSTFWLEFPITNE